MKILGENLILKIKVIGINLMMMKNNFILIMIVFLKKLNVQKVLLFYGIVEQFIVVLNLYVIELNLIFALLFIFVIYLDLYLHKNKLKKKLKHLKN
jgi:hypothetical protein